MSDFVPNNRFKDGDLDVDDRPREGRPKTFEDAYVIYYELLKSNETITGERYRTQLMRLSQTLREKRPQYTEKKMLLNQKHVYHGFKSICYRISNIFIGSCSIFL